MLITDMDIERTWYVYILSRYFPGQPDGWLDLPVSDGCGTVPVVATLHPTMTAGYPVTGIRDDGDEVTLAGVPIVARSARQAAEIYVRRAEGRG